MATDIAVLGLQAVSAGVVRATSDLAGLENQAKRTEQATDRMAGGAKKADDAVKREGASARAAANDNRRLADGAQAADSAFQKLAGVAGRLAGIFAATFSAGSMLRMADSWERMTNMVGAATRDMDRAGDTMERMLQISRASYSPMEQTVRTFSDAVPVFRNMGRTAAEAADYVESLNLMLVAGYVEGQRAESVQWALNKAMATGRLQAEGLETVLANSAEVSQALADELGVTTNQLRKMASEGKITGDVIARSLIDRLEDVRGVVAEMPYTIGGAMTTLRTEWLNFVRQVNQALQATQTLAKGLVLLAENIGRVAATATAFAVFMAGRYVASLMAGVSATALLTNGLAFLRGAIMRTGIGVLIVAAGEMIYQFTRLVTATEGFGNALTVLGIVGKEVWAGLVEAAGAIPPGLAAVWSRVKASFMDMLGDLMRAWGEFISGLAIDAGSRNLSRIPGASGIIEDLMGAGLAATQKSYSFDQRASGLRGEASSSADEAAKKFEAGTKRAGEAMEQLRAIVTNLDATMGDARDEAAAAAAALADSDSGSAGGGLAKAAAKAANQVDKLGTALDQAIRQGMEQAAEAANRGADAIGNVFSGLLDGAKSLRQGVADLIMEIAKMQMMDGFRTLFGAGGALGGFGGFLGGLLTPNALGGVYSAPGLSAYSGQIVTQPTVFPFAKGAGLMGEAGPEAILPLRRGPDGKLGVEAANQNGQPVNITVNVEGANGDQHVISLVQQGVSAGLRSYDQGLPDRLADINSKPRYR